MLGFAIVRALAERLGEELHSHVEAILPAIIDRLVDTKDPVGIQRIAAYNEENCNCPNAC
jgi:hypothetical protein